MYNWVELTRHLDKKKNVLCQMNLAVEANFLAIAIV